jgi:hypothetical protein
MRPSLKAASGRLRLSSQGFLQPQEFLFGNQVQVFAAD